MNGSCRFAAGLCDARLPGDFPAGVFFGDPHRVRPGVTRQLRLGNGAQIFCPRSSCCARDVKCDGVHALCERDLADLCQEILASLKV